MVKNRNKLSPKTKENQKTFDADILGTTQTLADTRQTNLQAQSKTQTKIKRG